ncbi:ATP-grasp domain-containing protein [Maribacter sp. 2304DJ31-5]|uniref:ATP-grasp domain-containing protein n=1 Tax=Maribacter sp. 2304DJ31-5 TaxID=3386273 RepID=UPI0039BC6FB1
MNILISSAGRRVSLVRAFQKELGQLVPEGRVFASDIEPTLASACHVADSFFKVPRVDEKDYMDILLDKCLENNIKLIIPTIDTELKIFATNQLRYKENGIEILISDQEIIDVCRDKRKIHSFFKSFGIKVAKEFDKNNYELPMFLKPWDGSRSVDTFLIEKESDLNEYHFNHEKLMFLEYLNHDDYVEYTCDLYYDRNNKLKCVVPRKRIAVRDGEVNKGLTENNSIVKLVKAKLATLPGAYGCLTAQFFKHKINDVIYGIEVNPRFGGGFPLTYLAGANYPKWIIEEYFFNKPILDAFDAWESNLLMLRYDDEILVRNFES